MEYRTICLETDYRGILSVCLNRPQFKNALNVELIAELDRVWSTEAQEKSIRAVFLEGAGDVFCAGGDLNWLKRSSQLSLKENLAETRQLSSLFSKLNDYPKPIVGFVQGAAIGGGVGLVSICDYVVATSDTLFSLSEVRLGIIPACIGPFLVSKIGPSHARALMILGNRFPAQRAKEIGLIHEVVTDANDLASEKERVLTQLLQAGPVAQIAAKKLVMDLTWPERRNLIPNYLDYVSVLLANLRVSPEGQEGISAFLEKRKPEWNCHDGGLGKTNA